MHCIYVKERGLNPSQTANDMWIALTCFLGGRIEGWKGRGEGRERGGRGEGREGRGVLTKQQQTVYH